ncbi:hypothetical protein FH972_026354 [Carpinus fangiana]|uniref:Uncharacterized protein n=1 Tax=Carpinus fangiana TaxID=176857 RepID=A0A5N6L3S4_9ROSI|nr:hypothetical protein FH972_026354 [Carpinus fangiana]
MAATAAPLASNQGARVRRLLVLQAFPVDIQVVGPLIFPALWPLPGMPCPLEYSTAGKTLETHPDSIVSSASLGLHVPLLLQQQRHVPVRPASVSILPSETSQPAGLVAVDIAKMVNIPGCCSLPSGHGAIMATCACAALGLSALGAYSCLCSISVSPSFSSRVFGGAPRVTDSALTVGRAGPRPLPINQSCPAFPSEAARVDPERLHLRFSPSCCCLMTLGLAFDTPALTSFRRCLT